MSLRTKLTALLNKANNKTGKQDTTLSTAVQTLIDGYGKGNGDAPIYDGEYIITDNGEIIYVTRDLDLSTFNLSNYYGNRLAFTNGVYSKGDTVDFVIPAEAFDFGDGKWCVQLRFRKNQEYGEFATLTGVKGEYTQNQVLTEFKKNGEINAYLRFPNSTGTTPVDQVFASEGNQLGVFYTLKIEYDGTGAYTTTLFDEKWNTLKKTVYESNEKVMYFGLNEILGGLYTSSDDSTFGFVGDFDLSNSYITHGDKVVWGIKEKGIVISDANKEIQYTKKINTVASYNMRQYDSISIEDTNYKKDITTTLDTEV